MTYKSDAEILLTKMKAYVKTNLKYLTEVIVEKPDKLKLLMLPDTLVLITRTPHDIMYLLSPVKAYNGTDDIKDYWLMMGHLFTVDEVIDINENPEAYFNEFNRIPNVYQPWSRIFLDGVQVYKTLSSKKCIKERNRLLRSRKDGWIRFDHLKVIDPERNHTDFLFNQNDPAVAAMRELLSD